MPIPEQRDPERARRRLTEWLTGVLPDEAHDVTVSAITGPASTGFSNETLLCDVRWHEGGQRHVQGLAVRVAPTGHHLFPEPEFDRQYRVMRWLDDHSTVAVPHVLAYEGDPDVLGAPFFVMERVEGRVPEDHPPYHAAGWLADASPADRERVWCGGIDSIASVHAVDAGAPGLAFLDRPELGDTPLEQELTYYERFLEWVERDEPVPVAEQALEWLRDNRPTAGSEPVLAWGDARIGNIVFDDALAPAALLDWEMATFADPALDVAWTLFMDRHHASGEGVERLKGFPSREETVRRYEACSGRRLHDLEYYELLAALRFTVIMARLVVLLKQWELLAPDDPMAREGTSARLTGELLGRR